MRHWGNDLVSLSSFIYKVGIRIFDLHDCHSALTGMISTETLAQAKGSGVPFCWWSPLLGWCWEMWKHSVHWGDSDCSSWGVLRAQQGTTSKFEAAKNIPRRRDQGCILSPAYLTYMQSTSWETLGWRKHKQESRLPGEISVTSDMHMTPPLWQKVKRNSKASWWKLK